MLEAATLIEAIMPAAQKTAARDDLAAGFSFAAAVSALEGRAAQSLETFGAAPQQSAPAQKHTSPSATAQPTPARAESNPPRPEAGRNPAATDAAGHREQPAAKPAGAPAQASAPAPQAATASAPAATAAPLPAAPVAHQPAPSPARAETVAAAKADIIKTSAPRTSPAPQPAQPQPETHDFAKLLAKRLDSGATKFELRLDPPELGRVEALLKVGDRGEAVLSLKFEHQAALDLFSRDADALRAALTSSGFDLGGERLAFSLADDLAPASIAESRAAPTADFYEPLFLAPYSRGAVDLRV